MWGTSWLINLRPRHFVNFESTAWYMICCSCAMWLSCDYHVTIMWRLGKEYFSLQNLFAKTLSIAKVLKISKGRRGKGGKEKGGKRRKSGEEGGKRKGGGKELNSEKCRLYIWLSWGYCMTLLALYCAISMSICTVKVAKFSQGSVQSPLKVRISWN